MNSDKGDNEFTPFRNLFNDFYARDTRKKIRAVMKAKGNFGEHLCTNPPYGYMKDPADKKKWIVDVKAAEVVKRIFALCVAPDKSSGHRKQRIEIVWNFVGELEQGEDKQTVERQRKSKTA